MEQQVPTVREAQELPLQIHILLHQTEVQVELEVADQLADWQCRSPTL